MAVPDRVVFDAFALAAAEAVGATLLVGGDDDYNEVSDIPIDTDCCDYFQWWCHTPGSWAAFKPDIAGRSGKDSQQSV
jgi:hypothetical protein